MVVEGRLESDADREKCAALYNEPRRGFERVRTRRRPVRTMTRLVAALALSPQLDLIAEQRHLYIEPPWGLESPLPHIRRLPQGVGMCCPL